jgi:S-disulfanyl-L-cysteine oxidoreductase SoxD
LSFHAIHPVILPFVPNGLILPRPVRIITLARGPMGLMTGQTTRNGGRAATATSVLRSVAIVAAMAAPAPVAWTQEPAAGRSTAAGVYSNEQADRGKAVFDAKCQSCHGAEFEGGTLAPALKGREFLSPFFGKPLRRIYSRIISTMPPDDVGSLSEAETLALVALVLRANGYPAGPEAIARADDLNATEVAPLFDEQDQRAWNAEAAGFRSAGLQACQQAPGSPEGLRYLSLRSRSVR